MKTLSLCCVRPLVLALVVVGWGAAECHAQDGSARGAADQENRSGWYYQPAEKVEAPRSIAQQKAIARGQQRTSRIAAKAALGYVPARPTVSGNPFFSAQGMQWNGYPRRTSRWFGMQRSVVYVAPPLSH